MRSIFNATKGKPLGAITTYSACCLSPNSLLISNHSQPQCPSTSRSSLLVSSTHHSTATSSVVGTLSFSLRAFATCTRSPLLNAANTTTMPHMSLATTTAGHPSQVGTGAGGNVPVTYTSGAGTGGALQAPATAITGYCDILSECLAKADELKMQMKAQEAGDASAQILTKDAMDEYVEELKQNAQSEIATIVDATKGSPMLWQQAGMHELRRTLYYATQLKDRDWLEEAQYTQIMRGLTVEFLRRDNEGVMAPDDVLYISTHVVISNFYNRHLWNRMEHAMTKWTNYENIDLASIKALSTKLFKTRRGCAKETLDVRRKILNAMARRVGTLANDFDLPSLLGVLQCYTVHDLMPRYLEPLAHRATNHISDFTPHECATLSQILRKWRLMRLEVCEKVVERICQSEQLSHHMAISALLCVKTCFMRISDGGRSAMNAEPMRQKLRAMGEQICCRLDEVTYPALPVILQILDVIVTMKVYVPKKCLQSIFRQANDMISVVTEGTDDLIDPKTGKRVRAITAEEGRQLQALLYHYGNDLSAELSTRLKEAFREGLLPDEASVF